VKVAVVTRECGGDRRYGMGRSWASVATVLESRGHELRRIDGDALDEIAQAEARRMQRRLLQRGPSLDAAIVAVLARAWAAGTLAARRVLDEGFAAVDCHDFMCAAGLRSEAGRLGVTLPPWGYHQHSFNAGWRGLDDFYGPLDDGLRNALRRIERRISGAAGWVIFPAASAATQCATDLGLAAARDNWTVLRHPVVLPTPMARDDARNALGLSPSAIVVLGVGQFVPLKRFDHLIRALPALPETCRLWLLGEGDQASLAELAHRLGVVERVSMRAVDDVGPWLAAADVYVSTSQTEAFGMANAEAVSAGLPCLIADTGAARELFAQHAMLLAADLADLEGQLQRLVADAGARRRLVLRTRGFARSLPTPEVAAARLLGIFSGDRGTSPQAGDSVSAPSRGAFGP
jgi:glycosyltransferase involved in cell wall biosynthesis